jgi:hypothetical protein
MSTQTNTNTQPTQGQKLFILIFGMLLLGSFVNFINIKSTGGTVEPIPIYQSALNFSKPNSAQISSQKLEKLATNSAQNLPISELKEISQNSQKEIRIDEIGVFVSDENKADLIAKTKEYIAKYSQNKVVLDAEMIANFAQKKQFPLDLILVQAQVESNFCTLGRAVQSKQCWNIGAFDAGDTKPTSCADGLTICQNSYLEGLELYQNFMVNCHFHEGEKPTIQKFVDRNFLIIRQGSSICGPIGARYATDKNYRQKIIDILQTNFNPIFTK